MKFQTLFLRVALGILFAFLLAHFFFPSAGRMTIGLIAVVLVFFAYVFEAIHSRER